MKNRYPAAYVICGFIGSGKTTFARKLEKETGAVRITKDEWIINIFGNKITSDKNFVVYDKKITELARETALKILKSGGDVIIDEGFWTKPQRDGIKKKILGIGAKPILYYVKCSVGKMRERAVTRSKIPSVDSFEISGEMFDSYLEFWQPPEKEEEFIEAK
ncbi:ATP-binding protein [Patescibacteria group bacterium]|nr:ATP-binding protein [Patescibacteria group bacterium]